MKPYASSLLACLRFALVVLAVALSVVASGYSGAFAPIFPTEPAADVGWCTAVAVDGSGNLYVADAALAAVRVRKIGADGHAVGFIGSNGWEPGQFLDIAGLTVDAAGNLYVSDSKLCRIQKFSPAGALLLNFGQPGTGAGQFSAPHGLTVDGAGNIYVADTDNCRIQKFDPAGHFVAMWGDLTGDLFLYPTSVAVDATGNIFVADPREDRICKLSPAGSLLATWPAASSAVAAYALSVDAAGTVYGSAGRSVQRYGADGSVAATWTTGGDGVAFQGIGSGGFAVTASGQIYVADNGNKAVRVIDSSGGFVACYSRTPWGGQAPNTPSGVATDAAGNLYLADTGNHRILKFTAGGTFLSTFGSYGYSSVSVPVVPDGKFNGPAGVAVDATGNIYVADTGNNRIQKFSADGTFLLKWGQPGGWDGYFKNPSGMAIDAAGNVYVADTDNSRVQKFAPNGVWIATFGVAGRPYGVTVDTTGNLYVTIQDTTVHGIQKLSPAGEVLATWSTEYLWEIRGLAVVPNGDVFAASWVYSRIMQFAPDGTLRAAWGGEGSEGGQFDHPWGVATDAAGNLFVADSRNHRVQKLVAGSSVADVPFVHTGTVTNGSRAVSVATMSGTVAATGGSPLTECGVVVSLSPSPTLASGSKTALTAATSAISGYEFGNVDSTDHRHLTATGAGNFTLLVAGLAARTTYHVRAYATNAAGVGYGEDVAITTPAASADGWANLSENISFAGAGAQALRAVATTEGTRVFVAFSEANIRRSDDGGTTFATVATAKASQDLFVFAGGTTVYGVGSSARGRKSTDGGLTWTEYYGVGSASGNYAVSFATTDIGYCGGSNGKIYRTADGGATWATKTSTAAQGSSVLSFAFPDPAKPDAGYVVVSDPTTLFKTTNGGQTWSDPLGYTMGDGCANKVHFVDATHGWFVCSNGWIFRRDPAVGPASDDYWYRAAQPVPDVNLNDVGFAPDGLHGWAVGNGGLILRSVDGGATWVTEASALGIADSLEAVSVISAAEAYIVGGRGTFLKYTATSLATAPTVETGAVSDITTTTATVAGSVTADGGAVVTARGVVWGTAANPTSDTGTTVAVGSGVGAFAATVGGLSPGTTYHVRAYATNATETAYGEDVVFTTPTGAGLLAVFLQEHGLDPATASGAPSADPDGDGVSNLMEFVLGGDPLAGETGLLPAGSVVPGGGTPVFDYSFVCTSAAASGFAVTVESSSDLATWTPAVAGQGGVTITRAPFAGGEAVTVRIPAVGARLFVRLRVVPR